MTHRTNVLKIIDELLNIACGKMPEREERMKDISNEVISLEEARAALKCMRLCSFDENEALESIDSLVSRIRKVGTARLVEEIIENRLSDTQRRFMKEYWFPENDSGSPEIESIGGDGPELNDNDQLKYHKNNYKCFHNSLF